MGIPSKNEQVFVVRIVSGFRAKFGNFNTKLSVLLFFFSSLFVCSVYDEILFLLPLHVCQFLCGAMEGLCSLVEALLGYCQIYIKQKSAFELAQKNVDSHHPAHAQSLIRNFALHWNIF